MNFLPEQIKKELIGIYSAIKDGNETCFHECKSACCKNTFKISFAEYALIAEFLKENHGFSFIEEILARNNDDCVFLSPEKKCDVYDARPYVCRIYKNKNYGCCSDFDVESAMQIVNLNQKLDIGLFKFYEGAMRFWLLNFPLSEKR